MCFYLPTYGSTMRRNPNLESVLDIIEWGTGTRSAHSSTLSEEIILYMWLYVQLASIAYLYFMLYIGLRKKICLSFLVSYQLMAMFFKDKPAFLTSIMLLKPRDRLSFFMVQNL